jgi:UDP-glucose-4-epimerase GalE
VILVTGGAGYIGSHTVRRLRGQGLETVILDDLSEGHAGAASGPLVRGDLGDREGLSRLFAEWKPRAVIHFAASCLVGESVADPAKYWRNNVANTLVLLDAMRGAGCDRLVFSSTCSLYGDPIRTPIDEGHPVAPINPYASTKAAAERAIDESGRAYGLRWTALRYFNAAGATPAGDLGEDHEPESHLIPRVLRAALGKDRLVEIYGNDYPTPDGTCVRDYIHVEDLAEAHILALRHLDGGGKSGALNLGTGTGNSVREVIEACRRVTGKDLPVEVRPRRPGDPAILVADGARTRSTLGWAPRFPRLEEIVETAWAWHRAHPDGFEDRGGRGPR